MVGSDHHAALEQIYKVELTSLGFSVQLFPAQSIFLEFYCASVLTKIIYRLGLSTIILKIQKKLKAFVLANDPRIVIIFKGMEITPKTILWIKNKGIKIYNYNPDHPFIFSGRGSGNPNVTKSINLYDNYFSYTDDAVKDLIKLGVKSQKIPFGFDSNGFAFRELAKENEVIKACFLGNADKFRIDFLEQIAQKGVKIDVYGENWSSIKLHENISTFGPKYGAEFWKILQKYALQLNLLRPHNLDSHNMRSFDIPGSGGIMLAPRTPDHQTYFTESTEVFLFSDVNEAHKHIQFILHLSFSERNKIRQAARLKAEEHHTYTHRTLQLVKYLDAQ